MPKGIYNRISAKERFELKYKINPSTGCRLWQCGQSSKYGYFWLEYKDRLAHRVAYELYIGKIPKGMCVCHKCDTPKCVNPDHLFLGTTNDNMQDMCNKDRQAKGTLNGNSKLVPKDVIKIRRMLINGKSIYATD